MALDPADVAAKVCYAIHELDQTRELTGSLELDLHRRCVGKSAFVLVESAIRLLRRLNNAVPTQSNDRTEIRKALNIAASDYESNFSLVRDKMHAHRQAVPGIDALNAWRSMHDDYVAYFRDELATIYEKIRCRGGRLPSLRQVECLPPHVRDKIRTSTIIDDRYLNASKQGLFSSSGCSVMLSGPGERGQEVLDAFDTLDLYQRLNEAVRGIPSYERTVVVLYLVEAIAMFDALFDDQNPDQARREPAFLDLIRQQSWLRADWQARNDYAVAVLEDAQRQIGQHGMRDRALRDKIAAHIDIDKPLEEMQRSLEQFDWASLSAAVAFARKCFDMATEHGPIVYRVLARHRHPMRGIVSVNHVDPPASYSD
jgi:hypothetical protein